MEIYEADLLMSQIPPDNRKHQKGWLLNQRVRSYRCLTAEGDKMQADQTRSLQGADTGMALPTVQEAVTTTGMSIGYPGEQGRRQRHGGVSEDPEHWSKSAQ